MSVAAASKTAASKAVQCVDRLKDKYPATQTFDELGLFVLNASERQDKVLIDRFKWLLANNSKIAYDRSTHLYRYKPSYDVSSPESLLTYFQKQDTLVGLDVRKLKEGWPDCEAAIDEIEAEHKIIVLRNKKDGHAKTVWADDPDLFAPMDDQFKGWWNEIAIPSNEEVLRTLQSMGHATTGEIVQKAPVNSGPKQKKKARRGHKITNTHMQGMLRDYSGKRPVGK